MTYYVGLSGGTKVPKWIGLRDPRSMVKPRDKGIKVFTSSLSVSLSDCIWKFYCLIKSLSDVFFLDEGLYSVCVYETLAGSQKPHSAAPSLPLLTVHRDKTG